MPVGKAELVVFELRLPATAPVAGKTIAEIVRRGGLPAPVPVHRRGDRHRPRRRRRQHRRPGRHHGPDGRAPARPPARAALPHRRRRRRATIPTARARSRPWPRSRSCPASPTTTSPTSWPDRRFERHQQGRHAVRRGPARATGCTSSPPARWRRRRGADRRWSCARPSYFGERTALTGQPRTRTVRVIEDAELLAVDGSALRARGPAQPVPGHGARQGALRPAALGVTAAGCASR